MLAGGQVVSDTVRHVEVVERVLLHVRRKASDEAAVEAERSQVIGLKQLEALRQWEQTCKTGYYLVLKLINQRAQ